MKNYEFINTEWKNGNKNAISFFKFKQNCFFFFKYI